MDLMLKGKKAIVSGATRGIGRAIVDLLAEEGCHIGLCARDSGQVTEAVTAVRAKGVQAYGESIDVRSSTDVKAWVDRCSSQLGGLDIIVSNVSAQILSRDEASWREAFEVDLMSAVSMVEAGSVHLEASKSACILFINSIMGSEHQLMTGGAYGGMKAALHNYAKGLAIDLAPKGIRVNSLTPGAIYFDGGVWQRLESAAHPMFAGVMALQPLGRMGTPEEIANVAAFLVSSRASFVSGANVVADGASTRRVQS